MRKRKLSIWIAAAFFFVSTESMAGTDPSPSVISYQEIENSILYYNTDRVYPNNIQLNIINNYLKELKDYPDTYIKVTSHADDSGDWEANLDVSRKRALVIAEYLRQYGVPQDRIILDWLGDDVPMSYKEDETHKNRRTHIRIVKKVKYIPNQLIAESNGEPAISNEIKTVKKPSVNVPPVVTKPSVVHVKEEIPVVRVPKPKVVEVPAVKKEVKVVQAETPKPNVKLVVRKPVDNTPKKEVVKVAKTTSQPNAKPSLKSPKTITTSKPVKDELVAKSGDVIIHKTIVFVDDITSKPVQVEADIITKSGKTSLSTSNKGEMKVNMNNLEKDHLDVYAYGYFFKSVKIQAGSNQQTIRLQPTDTGSKMELKDLQFVSGKDILLGASTAELDRLYLSLMMNPDRKVEIGGHINVPGKKLEEISDRQMQLSVDRAKAVYDFLVKKGIPKKRLAYRGYGNSEMIFPNPQSDEEKSKNRRVEIKILN